VSDGTTPSITHPVVTERHWAIPAWRDTRDLVRDLRLSAHASAVLADAVAGPGPVHRLDPRLEAARRWMEANCLTHPPLEAAARIVGFAPTVFHRYFTAAFAQTPRARSGP
jgi:transcriptional regulator GlxA family with amidase domain